MPRTSVTALALMLASVPVLAAPAHAETLSIVDPDDGGRGPDIVGVTVKNLDQAIVAQVQFAEPTSGYVNVSLDPRGDGAGVRMVSTRVAGGQHSDDVVLGANAFAAMPPTVEPMHCRGFQVRWDDDGDVVTMRLPSRCLVGGDYGDLRFFVIAGSPNRGFTDWAPEHELGAAPGRSPWVARG